MSIHTDNPLPEPAVWGLRAQEIHDARWRSRGVQVVHRESRFKKMPGAEIYLLLEPEYLVAFELHEIADAMIWNKALITRIRIIEYGTERFYEHIVTNDSGHVSRVKRIYDSESELGFRVLLTRSHGIAKKWASSLSRRDAWGSIRQELNSRIGNENVSGHCYLSNSKSQCRLYIDSAVATWEDPGRAIEGIVEIEQGIWAVEGSRLDPKAVCTAPAWIGYSPRAGCDAILAGPAWSEDDSSVVPGSVPVRLKRISEIMPSALKSRSRLIPGRQSYELIKRAFDVLVSLAVLICTLPIILLVSILVVIDNGFPIFFGHTRQAKNGRSFKCWKFRTMRRNAESEVAQFSNIDSADGPQVFIKDDPRVTRIGQMLRKYHLDEIPQFWNVLVGDMSIVGPRPSPEKENQFSPAWREIRLSVRPGITGLWQVERTRAPGLDFQEWIRYDIEYVRHAGFLFDLKICIKTLMNIIFR